MPFLFGAMAFKNGERFFIKDRIGSDSDSSDSKSDRENNLSIDNSNIFKTNEKK